MPDTPAVPTDIRTLAAEFAQPQPMRRGSLTERYVKCHKPGCWCSEREDARHGPYYSVSRVVGGRTRSRWLDAAQAERMRQQIAAGQQFRQRLEAYWQACERWADSQLEAEAGFKEAAKKGGFKAAFASEVRAEIEALVGPGSADNWDLEAIEMAVPREALRLVARAVEERINADTSDHVAPTAHADHDDHRQSPKRLPWS